MLPLRSTPFSSPIPRRSLRRGAVGSLDYVLVLGVIFPLVAIVLPLAWRIIARVYEMLLVLVAWPFM